MQFLENLFDSNYSGGGDSEWTAPSYEPLPAAYQRVYELPYTNIYGEEPAYLLLAARQGQEDSFVLQYSPNGADYSTQGNFSTFSQRAVLGETLSYNNISIDDEVGILITPYRDDPEFTTLSRIEFFSSDQFALIGNELIAFQTITPEGVNSFRLGGIIRGILNTTIVSSYGSGTEIWLGYFANNVYVNPPVDDFYVKLLPSFGAVVIDPGLAAAIHVVGIAKSRTPWDVSRIEVVKVGSLNTVTIWPTSQLFAGAGVESGQIQLDQWPPVFIGDLQWYTNYDGTINTEALPTWVITRAGAFTVYVRQRRSGRWSSWKNLSVGASNGTYTGPTS
jgi:hypothetical protein